MDNIDFLFPIIQSHVPNPASPTLPVIVSPKLPLCRIHKYTKKLPSCPIAASIRKNLLGWSFQPPDASRLVLDLFFRKFKRFFQGSLFVGVDIVVELCLDGLGIILWLLQRFPLWFVFVLVL